MASVDELFGKQMTWPRLIMKFGVETILAWNFYSYATEHRPDWDCFATDKKQPNGAVGENMTEIFTQVIYTGFIIALVGACLSFLEIINKKVGNKQLTTLAGIGDTLVGLAAFGWLMWATYERLRKNGAICSGATTNVNSEMEPYAYEQGAFLACILVLMYVVPPTLFIATNCGCL